MAKWMKALFCVVFSFSFIFMAIGYASVSDILMVSGQANVTPPNYDEVVITNVSVASGTTVSSEKSSYVAPTNVTSTITGTAGQVIIYKITAHNYSETDRYVYTGISCSSEFSDVASKLTISASMDQANKEKLPNDTSAKYTEGVPVEPGEDIVFYATYTLTGDIASENIWINYTFKPVVYTVTYLNDNETYAVDCITDNSVVYNVRKEGPSNASLVFAGWVNANAAPVESYPAGNTNDYMLSAKWDNVYLIIFADADGTVVYEEQFTSSSTKLSAEGQAIVDAKLAELNAAAAQKNMTVAWSSYTIAGATSDITVRAIYTYSGYLNLEPVYEQPDDGIVDYYQVLAVDDLPATVEVPGEIGGIPVKVINRITNIDGENDWNNYERNVKTIIVGEGVEILEWNSLSYTPNLTEVYLPSTIKQMGKNTFSRNDLFGNDKKKITINFNGTKAQWKAILANSDKNWDGGLKSGTKVQCTDGYFEINTWGSWKEH